ncbi:toll/interleukin-1 receptor domain-containing protein [Rheinheimera baltica]|uniref:Toll/interleukin-1 receptor domain-containing protein n=1 Tax=Rheinheimera baltica TaxID=67576 RepID=A0ABT9HU34_9GAMM|nr:toll/interleukin-1 receptor domain-containing protein [Rheinheimera baltica]MDP5134637.1 toll/interleukin-1 receptor domain-containing protein [Rheinheimera baltica]
MTWTEYTHAKHFGKGIYRPYSDFIADALLVFDNMLAENRELAHSVISYPSRDTLLIKGDQISILTVSGSSHRHYPLFVTIDWNEFWTQKENDFLENNPELTKSATRLTAEFLSDHLKSSYSFENPIIIIFPSVFQVGQDKDLKVLREKIVTEVAGLLREHELKNYMDKIEMEKPKEIFLSHKSADKALVREIAKTLEAMGHSPWLDEDKMKAGANLERSIRDGFITSCAAVFFITPNFKDEGYLATEIDYALAEKREKGDRFSIVTLLIPDENGKFGEVPQMIRQYVWKEVNPIEIIRTIVEALPIRSANMVWKA